LPRVRKKKRTKKQNTSSKRLSFGMRLSLLVVGTITIILIFSWVWNSKWPHTVATSLFVSSLHATQEIGFAVSDVTVKGRHYTDKTELFKALGVKAGSPIFLFDPEKSYKNIMALPWTKKVTVLRSLPNKIIINLTERHPIARLQKNKKTIVIDNNGQELKAAKSKQFLTLPLIIGNAKPKQIRYLLALLQRKPVVSNMLKAAVRVSNRRWNFYLRPKVLVKLPEHKIQRALTILAKLIKKRKILERNIKTIDLRVSNRMILEPYDDTNSKDKK